jgi:hypothetical protein
MRRRQVPAARNSPVLTNTIRTIHRANNRKRLILTTFSLDAGSGAERCGGVDKLFNEIDGRMDIALTTIGKFVSQTKHWLDARSRNAEMGDPGMASFKWPVSIKQSVCEAGKHGEKLSAFVGFKDSDRNDLLYGNDVDQHQYGELRAVTAHDMEAIARRVVLPQRSHIPLDKSEKQQSVIDSPAEPVLKGQSCVDVDRDVLAYGSKTVFRVYVIDKVVFAEGAQSPICFGGHH